jgi:hypothetical protein
MSVWTRGIPSKKKRAKMPAETPKAAPMGPLFAYVVSWGFPEEFPAVCPAVFEQIFRENGFLTF